MFSIPKKVTYRVSTVCPCGLTLKPQIEIFEPDYVAFLEQQNKQLKEALKYYADQTHCEIHDKNVAREILQENT